MLIDVIMVHLLLKDRQKVTRLRFYSRSKIGRDFKKTKFFVKFFPKFFLSRISPRALNSIPSKFQGIKTTTVDFSTPGG